MDILVEDVHIPVTQPMIQPQAGQVAHPGIDTDSQQTLPPHLLNAEAHQLLSQSSPPIVRMDCQRVNTQRPVIGNILTPPHLLKGIVVSVVVCRRANQLSAVLIQKNIQSSCLKQLPCSPFLRIFSHCPAGKISFLSLAPGNYII